MDRFVITSALVSLLCACPKPPPAPDAGVDRCAVDLSATGFFAPGGSGASAKVIDSEAQLIGGSQAAGRLGDVLLQNELVRVIIEQPGRTVGPLLSGGAIIDADLQRPSAASGRDAFGRMALFYAMGRLSSVKDVEILSDGSQGGPAIVASTGKDVAHDLFNIKSMIANVGGINVDFVVDPAKPLPLRATTYYVLSPGESRVRMLTAFCNDGATPVIAPLIEVLDVGAFEIFNPGPCSNKLGTSKSGGDDNCTFSTSKWFGTQGEDVAYGVRSYSLGDLTQPTVGNALLAYAGVVGVFVDGESLSGLLSWTNPEARTRPGTFIVRPGQWRGYLRDFVVAKDLAAVHGALLASDATPTGAVNVSAKLPGGAAAAGARVTVLDSGRQMIGLMVADSAGKASASLAPGSYQLSGSLQGRLVGPEISVAVSSGQTSMATVMLGEAHTLTINVKDGSNAPLPAKVTVFCRGGTCPFSADTYRQHYLLDPSNLGAAAVGFVPVSGELSLILPPQEYDVVVSRGPEYSTWPDTWPLSGFRVDLRTADARVAAKLVPVVETTGWMSADLHVHAINSFDSAVANSVRAANFLAEGVDVLVSTDHDVITDFAPYVRELGAESWMATVIGEEVTSFSHGHFNSFPLTRNPALPNGGALDHAGGEEGPTLRMPQLFSQLKADHPGSVVQLNHPRGAAGVLTLLKVDTATLQTRGRPADYNMASDPLATADDSKLLGDGFDLVESANGPLLNFEVLNDWMTFLSRGTVRTATGVSDSHKAYSDNGGYARTWIKVGTDAPAQLSASAFAEALRRQRAFVSNGPIISFTAQKLNQSMMPIGPKVEMGETLSVAANDRIELTVDIQGLEWMQLDRVDLYSHAPGREAVNGVANAEWPEGRVLQKRELDPLSPPLEAVPGTNLRRLHIVEKFIVQPAADTWFVAMARATKGRLMLPLHDGLPMAYSNAILIDADGSGAYDNFPLKVGKPLRVAPPHPPAPPKVPSEREFVEAVRKMLEHKHQ